MELRKEMAKDIRQFVLSRNGSLGAWSIRVLRKTSNTDVPGTLLLAGTKEEAGKWIGKLKTMFPNIPIRPDMLLNTEGEQQEAKAMIGEAGNKRKKAA